MRENLGIPIPESENTPLEGRIIAAVDNTGQLEPRTTSNWEAYAAALKRSVAEAWDQFDWNPNTMNEFNARSNAFRRGLSYRHTPDHLI